MKFISILTILCLATASHARDPSVPDPNYGYDDDPVIAGGGNSTAGDTFVLCGMAVMVAMIFALPEIFNGESQEWPVHKFRMGSGERCRVFTGLSLTAANPFKFPTRSL